MLLIYRIADFTLQITAYLFAASAIAAIAATTIAAAFGAIG